MFHEQIAKQTADHLRTHIEGYLDEVNAWFPDDQIQLTVPKSIDVSSVVGGLFASFNEILPQYGIDISNKVFVPEGENLWTYQYTGQINGMLHGNSEQFVSKAIARHAAAVELFIKRHSVMHELETDQFTIVEMVWVDMIFSGAEDLGEVEGQQTWLAGFSIDLGWITSEQGPGQHG